MMVPTAIPAMAPGDNLGRVVVTGGKRVTVGTISPDDKLGRTMVGGRAVARERNTSVPLKYPALIYPESVTDTLVGIY